MFRTGTANNFDLCFNERFLVTRTTASNSKLAEKAWKPSVPDTETLGELSGSMGRANIERTVWLLGKGEESFATRK